ncbi:hypothetical protein GGR53DRAFT_461829 [Hypoxylon sp. FL1150]|nr:hypothetical protein GGR53DRAFT_461829 [Hypoxylon sp. FL1150]
MATATLSTIILGPLTTTWTPPPACTVVVAACSTCTYGWAAQSCPGTSSVTDDPSCWPPRMSGAYTPPASNPLLAWGIYTPGSICPQGYSAACSYDGGARTGDFEFDFSPRKTETVNGCCPTYVTSKAAPVLTCALVLTSATDAIPTVTCESGTSAAYDYLTVPFAAIDTSRIVSISTFTVLAPLFQLVHQISTSPSTSTSTSTSTTVATSTSSQQNLLPSQTATPSANPSEAQGLSTGAKAGIGCGIGLGAIILGAVAFYVCRYRKRKVEGDSEVKRMRELTAYTSAAEMGTDRGPVELEARHGFIPRPPYGQTPPGFQAQY